MDALAPRHPSHARSDHGPIDQPLYVVTMLSNPLRWRSRTWNYWQFEQHMRESGAVLYTAEIALGERPFEITQPGREDHLQLRTTDELWHKENALNLLIQRLPADARYIAWIDADIQFTRPNWAQETIQQLQHYQVLQLFSQAQDIAPDYSIERPPARSFCSCYVDGLPGQDHPGPLGSGGYDSGQTGGVYWHPGFAWAARRDALDSLGMLIDYAVLGSADWHMACALIGEADKSMCAQYTPAYRSWVKEWENRAERSIRHNIGYVPGTIMHHYHGAKANRGYDSRYKLLAEYDPVTDIKRDWQGLYQLDPDNIVLRDNIRRSSRNRREDD